MNIRQSAFLRPALTVGGAALLLAAALEKCPAQTPPLLTNWLTTFSSRYARVTQTNGGTPVTTWPGAGLPNMGGGQSVNAYADAQQISYSANYVYIKGAGLASHQMGPWYNGVNVIFGNWPKNQKYIRRFPRNIVVPTAKTTNGLGAIGLWANGVSMFNLLDAFAYNTAQGQDAQSMGGNFIWYRNAVSTEAPTFDKSNAHQPPNGEYHYHDNPIALRYQLGDNVSYNAAAGVYSENAANLLHHSPILGWAYDGCPVYGPYGYAKPTDATSGVRRLVSGFVIRDGGNGSVNLATAGRHTLAKWSATLHNVSQTLAANQYGPAVSANYPLGRYVEDFDFLGDLGKTQGTNFDLDIYNGRFCVTPDYPGGIYAYFVTLDSTGAPAFPYIIGRQYYGTASGGSVALVTEAVTIYKDAGPYAAVNVEVNALSAGKRVKWLSIEGGHYKLEGSLDGSNWTSLAASVTSSGLTTAYTFAAGSPGASAAQFRVTLISTDTYDPAPH